MNPHKWKDLPNFRKHQNIPWFMWKIPHFFDKISCRNYRLELFQKIGTSIVCFHFWNSVQYINIFTARKKRLIEVTRNQIAIQFGICRNLPDKMFYCHFFFRIIAKNMDVNLITEPFPRKKFRFLNEISNLIKSLHYIAHNHSPQLKQLNAGRTASSPFARMEFSSTLQRSTEFRRSVLLESR